MRFTAVTIALGFSVLTGQLGVHGSAIPVGLDRAPSYAARSIAIKKPRRGVANPLLQRAAPGALPAAPATPKGPAGPKPVTQPNPAAPKNPTEIQPLSEEQLTQEAPAIPDTRPEPKTLLDAIDIVDQNDRSDWVVKAPCAKAKREEPSRHGLMAPLDRRSGDDMVLTWPQWLEIFKQLDLALSADPRITSPISISLWGGSSGIAFGSRGDDGKTGDVDFNYHTGTSLQTRGFVKEAINKLYAAYKGLVDPDFLNDKVYAFFSTAAVDAISKNSKAQAFDGNMVKVFHAPWVMQLFNKLDRMHSMKKNSGGYKGKDKQDAIKFLQKAKEELGRDVNLQDVQTAASLLGNSADYVKETLEDVGGMIQEGFEGFDDSVMKVVEGADCT